MATFYNPDGLEVGARSPPTSPSTKQLFPPGSPTNRVRVPDRLLLNIYQDLLTCIASKEVLTPQRDQPHRWENNEEVMEAFKIIFAHSVFLKSGSLSTSSQELQYLNKYSSVVPKHFALGFHSRTLICDFQIATSAHS